MLEDMKKPPEIPRAADIYLSFSEWNLVVDFILYCNKENGNNYLKGIVLQTTSKTL